CTVASSGPSLTVSTNTATHMGQTKRTSEYWVTVRGRSSAPDTIALVSSPVARRMSTQRHSLSTHYLAIPDRAGVYAPPRLLGNRPEDSFPTRRRTRY